MWEIKDLVGETPLIFDREFSAQRWLKALEEAGCEWVVRLNTKSKVKLKDAEGEEVPLFVREGEREQMEGVYLLPGRGEGERRRPFWREDQKEPLWVMGSLPPAGAVGRGLR